MPAGGAAPSDGAEEVAGAGGPRQWHVQVPPADPWGVPAGPGAPRPWIGSGGPGGTGPQPFPESVGLHTGGPGPHPGTGGPGMRPDSGAAGPYPDMGDRAAPPHPAGPAVPAGGPAPWRSAPGGDVTSGPSMPPPWGDPPPYGFGPPPRRAHSGQVAALVGGAVLVVILLVIGVATVGGTGDDPKEISGKAANQAGTALGDAPGLTLSGTYAGGQARFDVTRAGSARGSYSSGGTHVGRVDVADGTFLKAGSAFWTAQGVSATRAGKAGGKWTKAPDFAVELNLSDLSPARLAQVLQGAGNDPNATMTKVNGVQAIRMTAGGRIYYVAAKGARRLLRVQGDTDAGRFSFDVTPLTAAAMGGVFAALRTDVRGLVNAYAPEISVQPVSKLRFGDCTEPGCTVSVDVRPSAEAATSATIRVSMNVTFRGTRGTVSECSATTSARTGRQRTLSCRAGGHAWSSWYGSQTGRFTIHAGAVFSANVNSAGDVSALLDKLSQEQRGD